mmetsp:Transcript_103783/g.298821  ORF Transcript_103783/g.298821 Transcript_103783/m.298821 type:complete len:207 (+) Transcript_103783:515-1135(+)
MPLTVLVGAPSHVVLLVVGISMTRQQRVHVSSRGALPVNRCGAINRAMFSGASMMLWPWASPSACRCFSFAMRRASRRLSRVFAQGGSWRRACSALAWDGVLPWAWRWCRVALHLVRRSRSGSAAGHQGHCHAIWLAGRHVVVATVSLGGRSVRMPCARSMCFHRAGYPCVLAPQSAQTFVMAWPGRLTGRAVVSAATPAVLASAS